MAPSRQPTAPKVAACMSDVLIVHADRLVRQCYEAALDGFSVRLPDGHLGGMPPYLRMLEILRAAHMDPDPDEVRKLVGAYRQALALRRDRGEIVCDPAARACFAKLKQRGYRIAFVHTGYDTPQLADALGLADAFAALAGVEDGDVLEDAPDLVARVLARIPGATPLSCCGIVSTAPGARMFVRAGASALGIVGATSVEELARAGAAPNYRSLTYITPTTIEEALAHRRLAAKRTERNGENE